MTTSTLKRSPYRMAQEKVAAKVAEANESGKGVAFTAEEIAILATLIK